MTSPWVRRPWVGRPWLHSGSPETPRVRSALAPRVAIVLVGLAAAGITGGGAPLAAQLAADSTPRLPADRPQPPSVAPATDSTVSAADTLLVGSGRLPPDTTTVPDTLPPPFYNPPRTRMRIPEGWATGSWVWEHSDLMASGANTLVELMADLPGIVPLLAGDYGTPATISAFGAGGGGVRVIRDGFELYALEGGVADLQRIALGGIERVRVERNMGEVLVHLDSFDHDDGRAFSLIEAGTGDLDTNLLRGAFTNPTALGGSLGLALDRVDTRGPRGAEPGERTGAWIRYQLHRGNRAGLAVDYRRMSTQSEVPDYATPVTRSDLVLTARAEVGEGWIAEAYTGRSSHGVNDTRADYVAEGGTRAQHGVSLAFDRPGAWARGGYRLFPRGLLNGRLELVGGAASERFGGIQARVTRTSWEGASTESTEVRGWTRSLAGLSLFGSWEDGTFGAASGPLQEAGPDTLSVLPVPDPTLLLTERRGMRLGAIFVARGVELSAAALALENDGSLPLGLEPDRGAPTLAGGDRRGWEVWGSLPLRPSGLRLEGSLQRWDEPGPYLPERVYRGALVFHRVFMESRNLELWANLGVRGHDPMVVPADPLGGGGTTVAVPFYQSWDGRIQVRIVSMRIFVGWENLTVRRNLQSYPGRVLPTVRAFYGLRWTLWN